MRRVVLNCSALLTKLKQASGRVYFAIPDRDRPIGRFFVLAQEPPKPPVPGNEPENWIHLTADEVRDEFGRLDDIMELADTSGQTLGYFVPTSSLPAEIVAKGEAILAARPDVEYGHEELLTHSELWERILRKRTATSR